MPLIIRSVDFEYRMTDVYCISTDPSAKELMKLMMGLDTIEHM